MGVADFGIFGCGLFAGRFPCALDEAAIGDEILDPREALDIVDLVE